MLQQPITASSTRRAARTARKQKRWLAQLIPSAHEQRALDALATGMSGLAVRKQSVALEIAAFSTPIGVRRCFLVRAETLEGRTHICSQLQENYSQAKVRYLEADEDPLQISEQEEVSCVEMRLGAPAYLPLRTWQRKALDEEGSDPLLNVLAALKQLPPKHRAVVQLVLTPAPDTWSRKAQRLAQQRPLEDERSQRQLLASARPRNTPVIENELFLEGLGALLLVFLLGYWLWAPLHAILPHWVWQAGSALVHGQAPHLSAWDIVQLSIGTGVILAVLVALGWTFTRLKGAWGGNWRPSKIYDPALVRQKTEHIAYRATLRLYVIGPRPQERGTGKKQADQLVQTVARGYRLAAWAAAMHKPLQASWWKSMAAQVILRVQAIWRARVRVSPWLRDYTWTIGTRTWWKALFGAIAHRVHRGKTWGRSRWIFYQRQRRAAKERRKIIYRLIAAFRAYHLASGNFFVPRRTSMWQARRRLQLSAPSARVLGKPGWQAAFFTPNEVASLYHLLQDADLRNRAFLERGGARTLPVPWQLATERGDSFGINIHAGARKPVFFPEGGLAYNLLALAGTGKGKSSLFAHLARVLFADLIKRGAVLVDPHGDLALVFLGCVPRTRRDDVVYLNLGDKNNPPGLNFLDMSSGQNRDKVVDMLLTIFRKWWGENWGSRIENTLQYCLLTLAEVNRARCRADLQNGPQRQCTILSIVPLLTQPDYREALLKEFKDSDIWNWWNGYYKRQKEDDQLDIAASVITKISKFRASKTIRRIVGQPVSSISLADIVTNGRILVVNTASGVVGEDTSTLCGSMLLGLLRTYIAEQAEQEAAQRTPIYVFLDEMQHYTGVNLNGMMAELRKYGGNFALATQSFAYLDALDKTLKPTLLANTDQLFAFDMSADDAEIMAKEIGDGIEASDILSLDNYACYAKLTDAGARLPAFSLNLLPPPQGDPAVVKALQNKSANTYGRPARQVDKLLRQQDQLRGNPAPESPQEDPDEDIDDDGLSPDFNAIDRDDQARRAGPDEPDEP